MPAPSGKRTVHLPREGPFALPRSWTACSADRDCTVVSLGCCDATPVNTAHAGELRRALDDAQRRYCPVKSACAPTASGTWDGEHGRCGGGACQMPSAR